MAFIAISSMAFTANCRRQDDDDKSSLDPLWTKISIIVLVVVQLPSCDPMDCSIPVPVLTISQTLFKFMSIESQ